MRSLTALALLTLSAAGVQATAITVTHSYEFPDGDYSVKRWTLPPFDASLGELEYVEYYASGSMWAEYEFRSMIDPGAFSVNVGGFFSFSGPGYNFRVIIPTKGTGQQWEVARPRYRAASRVLAIIRVYSSATTPSSRGKRA